MSSETPYKVILNESVRLPEDKGDQLGRQRVVSVEAVSSLEKARKVAFRAGVTEHGWGDLAMELMALDSNGGSVLLPDGGSIEVKPTTIGELVSDAALAEAAMYGDTSKSLSLDELCQRFNAAQGERGSE